MHILTLAQPDFAPCPFNKQNLQAFLWSHDCLCGIKFFMCTHEKALKPFSVIGVSAHFMRYFIISTLSAMAYISLEEELYNVCNISHLLCVCVCVSSKGRKYKDIDLNLRRLLWRSAWRGELLCSNAYGGWFAPCARHSLRMTNRPNTALRLLGSLRISHNKFLQANK